MDQDPRKRRDDDAVDLLPGAGRYAYPAAGAGASQPSGLAGPTPYSAPPPGAGGDVGPTGPSAGNFLAGVWLVLAPFALDYGDMGAGFDGFWNDVVIGIAIAVFALVRMLAPYRSAALGAVNVVLGGWLISAPFVLAYHVWPDSTAAVWNDVVVGTIVVVLAMISFGLGLRGPRETTAHGGR